MPPTTRTRVANGATIKGLREALGMSQGDLATAAGWEHQGHLSRIEAGKAQPSPPKLAQLAQLLHVDVDAISTPVDESVAS